MCESTSGLRASTKVVDGKVRILLSLHGVECDWTPAAAARVRQVLGQVLGEASREEQRLRFHGWYVEHSGDIEVLVKGDYSIHLNRYGGSCRMFPRSGGYMIAETKIHVTDDDDMRERAGEWGNRAVGGRKKRG